MAASNNVELLADGNVIPTTVQSRNGTTVTVVTDGSTALTHELHEFTAIQIAPSQTENTTQGGAIPQTADVPSQNSLATALTVGIPTTVGLASGQAAVTNADSVSFLVTFANPVTNFNTTTVNGATNLADSTAFLDPNSAKIAITPTGTANQYTVTVTGMDQDGTVVFNCPADTYHDAAGDGNALSTGTQNIVTYDTTSPTVTVALTSDQPASTTAPTAKFLVTFSEPVTDFSTATVNGATNLSGSTAFSNLSDAQIAITPTGTASQFTVTVTGLKQTGTVVFSCPTDTYHDAAGNGNTASTGSATVNYTAVKTLTLQLSPSTITEGDGKKAAIGTVYGERVRQRRT